MSYNIYTYSIYTLWGELAGSKEKQVIQVRVPNELVSRPIWRVIVEREDEEGHILQKDVTLGLTLLQAVDWKEHLARVYVADGFVTYNNLNFYPVGQKGKTTIYLDVEASVEA